MLFGMGLGVFASVLIFKLSDGPEITRQSRGVGPSPAPDKRESVSEETEGTRFDFYELLPKFEVVIPEQERDVRPDVAPEALDKPGTYVLQAGSFQNHADADRMRATLALQGITSRIQKVSIDRDTWHRVRVGPIEDLDELNRVRQRLREAEIEVLVIRVPE